MTVQQAAETKPLTDEQVRMIELVQQGFHCSEVLLFMGLHALGRENPDLIRSVSGLAGGIGFTGEVCGALTGGACLLGLHAGRGTAKEHEDPRMRVMIQDLVEWFSTKYGGTYGGIRCSEITGDEPANVASRCPRLVTSVYKKVKSLLEEHHISDQVRRLTQEPSPCAKRACPVAGISG